jgi:hypothetical protein
MTLKPMQIGLITGFGGLALLGLVVYGMKQYAPEPKPEPEQILPSFEADPREYDKRKKEAAAARAARDIINKRNEAYEGSNPNATHTKRLRKFKPGMDMIDEYEKEGGSRKFRKKRRRKSKSKKRVRL